MILKTLKSYFNSELSGYYPDTEIASFFYILSENILKLTRVDIALNVYQVVSRKKYDRFKDAVERLKNHEPIQYILGETEFYGLPLSVNNNVLIPRPETEELVDLILNSVDKKDNLKILDIGTGSGCIAISLAKNLPHVKVYALDVSPEAIEVAKENAKLNEVKIDFIEADILEFEARSKKHEEDNNSFPFQGKMDFDFIKSEDRKVKTWKLEFDIIVSNPPYVRELEKAEIKNNVLENEPHLALFVEDDDALQFYKAICQFTVNNLSKNGLLFFEINEYLGDEMIELLKEYNFKNIELKKDIFGKDRMLKSRKS